MELLINKNETDGDIQLSIMNKCGSAFCMLNYYENEKHAMFFSNFCINKESRGCGLGSIMINEVMKYAKGLGCEYLYLDVIVSDKWVCDWYERLGFVGYKNNGDRISMFKKLNK